MKKTEKEGLAEILGFIVLRAKKGQQYGQDMASSKNIVFEDIIALADAALKNLKEKQQVT